jgi:hypothetical protein
MRVEFSKARCRLHGGLSTGPKTKAGRERIAEAQRRRWRAYRERRWAWALTPELRKRLLAREDARLCAALARAAALGERPIMVTKDQLDQLEVRGYLDPGRRGERIDECDAIESFLADSLIKSR